MNQIRYTISDASKKVAVEPHVLRYWEEELDLTIPRNAMGHRYYTEEEMEKIQGIKRLKEEGFQLKAIKLVLPSIDKVEQLPIEARNKLCDELNEKVMEQEKTSLVLHTRLDLKPSKQENKLQQFQEIMTTIVQNAISESNRELSREVSKEVVTSVVKEVDYQFRMREEREEAHYRKIDEMLRSHQKKRRKKGLFRFTG